MNTLKFGNGEWYGKEDTILAYNSENNNYKPLPFTFERASIATVVGKDGLIKTVGANEPRIDYLNDSNGALKLEPQSTNLITYSEDFSQSNWSKTRCSLGDKVLSPNGTISAYKIIPNTENLKHEISINVSAYTTATVSLFAKAAEKSRLQITKSNWGTTDFDLLNETVTSGTGNIEDYGNGWYRLSASYIASPSQSSIYILVADDDGDVVYSGNNSDGIYFWGIQLEEQSYATSYIPTQGSAVTRLYDTMPTYLDLTPLNIGNSYTLFLDANLNNIDNNKVFSALNNSLGTISFTIRNNVGGIRLYNHIDASYPVSGITSSTNKFVIRVDGNSYKVFVQGSSLSGTLTTPRDLGSLNFYGQNTELKINNFTIDDTALSDAECQALVN